MGGGKYLDASFFSFFNFWVFLAILVFAGGMMAMPFDFPQLIEWIRNLGLPAFVIYALKFIIAFPIVFHPLNGIRFLVRAKNIARSVFLDRAEESLFPDKFFFIAAIEIVF